MESFEHNISVDKERFATLTAKAEKYSKKVATIITKKDYTQHEIALAVAGDDAYQQELCDVVAPLKNAKHVALIGIGGSNLGAVAVYHALALQTNPQLHILDSIEPDADVRFRTFVDTLENVEDVAIAIVSKSGNTTETVTNATTFIEICEKKFGKNIRKRIIFVGTEESDFLKNGKKEKVLTARIPEKIGGRYSLFSASCMVSLLLLGMDTVSLREGSLAAMEKENRSSVIERATKLAILAERGVHTVNFFTFNERLRILGYWYRQLLAESIGKQMKTDGATFSHQLLPTVATSVDLHSMAQLYLGGYKGMYTHFVYGDIESNHHKFSDHWMLRHLSILKGHTPLEIKNAIREGVLKAYDDQKLPYRLTSLPKITAYELGFLMTSLMFEVMVLGELFDVDPFNQPNVESYKSHTRDILST